MRPSLPPTTGQLENLCTLAATLREPFRYPLTRRAATRELRRLAELRRDQVSRARASRLSLEIER